MRFVPKWINNCTYSSIRTWVYSQWHINISRVCDSLRRNTTLNIFANISRILIKNSQLLGDEMCPISLKTALLIIFFPDSSFKSLNVCLESSIHFSNIFHFNKTFFAVLKLFSNLGLISINFSRIETFDLSSFHFLWNRIQWCTWLF